MILPGVGGWGGEVGVMGRLGSEEFGLGGQRGWSRVWKNSSQGVGVGEVRGVRRVGVEVVGGVWVEGRVGTGELGGLGSGVGFETLG